jgi:hypothetical protein
MSVLPPVGFTAESITANTSKLSAEMAGFWDIIVEKAANHGLIPRSMSGRAALVLAGFYAGAIMEWHMSHDTALGRILKTVATDAPAEIGARIMALADQQRKEL